MCVMCDLIQLKESCGFANPDQSVTGAGNPSSADLQRALAESNGDAANNSTTIYSMDVGDTFEGTLSPAGDWDWISINLDEGETVQISMDGRMDGGVEDTLLSLWGPTGGGSNNYLASNDDFGSFDYSQFTYTADIDGTYFIIANSYFGQYSGTYEIEVVKTDTPTSPGDGSPVESIEQSNRLTDTTIDVYFAPSGFSGGQSIGTYTSEGFNDYELGQFELAFDLIEAVTNVTFDTVNSSGSADFVYLLDSNGEFGALGAHEFPNNFGAQHAVYNGQSWDRTEGGDLEVGGYGFVTIIHEILHGLGLAHPHDNGGFTEVMSGVTSAFGDYGDEDLNQGIWSTMSYNTGWETEFGSSGTGDRFGVEAGPMAFDIAALQNLYGANTNTNSGNTTYRMPETNASGTYFSAIWDAGGTDVIDYDGSTNVTINLRGASLQYDEGGGGFVSRLDGVQGGFTIADGARIENADGGEGNDALTGNSLDNQLWGRGGNDNINGRGGDDAIKAGSGNDTVYGGEGEDSIEGSSGDDEIHGEDGKNKLFGQAGNDLLYGGRLADTVNGGGDNDTAYGDDGKDKVKGGKGDDTLYGENGDDKLFGNNGSDELYGGNDDDLLKGGGRADILDGGAGDDRIKGGDGDDDFIFTGGRDKIVDFSLGEGDELLIDSAFWDTGDNGASVISDHASVVGGDRVEIDFGNGNVIVLQDVTTTAGLSSIISEYD